MGRPGVGSGAHFVEESHDERGGDRLMASGRTHIQRRSGVTKASCIEIGVDCGVQRRLAAIRREHPRRR